MIIMVESIEERKPIKILILGLSNSGKTSICLCLQRMTDISHFSSLSPTKNYEIYSFEDLKTNTTFVIWDFGGQEDHLKEHLDNFHNNYIIGTNKIIYVIDIQDVLKYDQALKFLKDIVKELKKEDLGIEFSIFLHKYDPHTSFNEEIISNLINKIKEILPQDFKDNIFRTSISAVFRKTPNV